MKIKQFIKKIVLLSFGVILVAIALELFLIPNKIIDGGVVGISIISSYLSKLPLSLFIFTLNLPFLVFGYKKLGKNFTLTSFYCITLLSLLVNFIHNKPCVTDDLLLACIFGGIILGTGLGIILRNNGSLDGTEVMAVVLNKKTCFSVGEIIMFFNLFILGSAGFIFGWDRAMYSLLAYFIIFKTVDIVIEGLDESKSIIIISDKYEEIAQGIINKFEIGVTYIEGQGAYSGEYKRLIFCVITRLELTNLKSYILDTDPSAFIAVENVHEFEGGQVKKQKCNNWTR
ncbi:MAG: YitT family protein [Candidatus Gastranaerophilales bacterium]|nr:YitT family protein [Candidatus Gastranaerophilales bacterium]